MKSAVLVALALISAPRLVAAGCPGGGGGGGGGGAASGGGGGGNEVPLDAYVVPPRGGDPLCVDDTEIVGLRHCKQFGAWGVNLHYPPVIIEGGAVMRRFDSLLDGQTSTINHGDTSFVYRATAIARRHPQDTALLSSIRLTLVLPHHFYIAAENDAGGLTRPGDVTTEMMTTSPAGTPMLTQDGGFIDDAFGIVGVRTTFGFGAVGAELAGGLRTVAYDFDSRYLSCATTSRIVAYSAIAEARVHGEVWLGPWIAAGVTVGTSVLEQHAWMGAVYLGFHTRAFNGER